MSSEDSNLERSKKNEKNDIETVHKADENIAGKKIVLEEKLFELNKKLVNEKNERRKKQYEAEIKKIQEQISFWERRYEIAAGMYIMSKANAEYIKTISVKKDGIPDLSEMHKNSTAMLEGVKMMAGGFEEELRLEVERKKQKEKGIKYKALRMLEAMHIIKRKR